MAKEAWEILEDRRQFKEIKSLLEKVLYEQWNDAVYSGVINTFFAQYKRFFIPRRGVKNKMRKSEENVRSLEELKQLERETRQADRLVLEEGSLNMKGLLVWLGLLIAVNLKSTATYYKLKSELREYLKGVANRGGQSILDELPTTPTYAFRLTNTILKEKIAERINALVKSLDETTKKKLINELVAGIKLGETKTQLIRRLEKVGKDLAKYRANLIARTETQSVYEYMRYETAKTNGSTYKTWRTAGIEGTCPVCRALDGVSIPIDQNFRSETFYAKYPPVHPNCACSVHYDLQGNMCSGWIKSGEPSIKDKMADIFEKLSYGSVAVTPTPAKCINPNAVWAGGEGLVGKDRAIGVYYDEIINYGGWNTKLMVERYRDKLSPEGYVQLRLKLGLGGKVMANTL